MKLTFAVVFLLATAAAKPQSFFPDEDPHDNLKLESVSSPSLAFPSEEGQSPPTLDTESAKTIDTIVTATREGRKLEFNDTRFEQLLQDPSVHEKIVSASEVEARGFIHDKLCAIGLCDNHGHHGHGLGSAVQHVQLVQPVAIKPVGHPIPAVPLENKGKHLHHGHGLNYGPPPPPPFGGHHGHGNGGFGFGGASGGLIPKPGGPQIFPGPAPQFGHHNPPPPPAFKPNYGPPVGLPIVKPLNTHVHHHIHHHEPVGHGHGHGGAGVPYLDDGYYGAAQKSSLSVATPAGKALGTYPQAQTQTAAQSFAKNCVCVPAEQCFNNNNYEQGAGSQQLNQVLQGGIGIPNNGFVGYGIDPRNLKNGGAGIESNSTEADSASALESSTSSSEFPESPAAAGRQRRETGGFEGGILKPAEASSESEPRQLNYNQNLPRNCQPGFVCCQNPSPSSQSQYLTQPSIANNNFVDYNNGRYQHPQQQQQQQQYGQCGKRQTDGINGRVISGGGNPSTFSVDGETSFGDYPWHVAILKNNGFVCSGSLIDSFNILTAAHCIKRMAASELKVRLGEWDVNHETEFYPFVEAGVESITTHPDFYAGNLVNDVAILRLASSIDFPRHPHISPICLPPPNLDFAGTRCFVSGWGKDAFGNQGKFQNVLKEVDLPVLSHFDCEQKLKRTRLGRDFALDKGFVCAGGEANKDACKGDGGGGLVCDVQGTWYLAGIVSWGVGCGEVDVPGVYAKISQYTPWIQQNTGIIH